MKIQFGSNDNAEARPFLMGFMAFLLSYSCCYFQIRIKWRHELILNSSLASTTLVKMNKYCGLPYNDYRCSTVSPTYNISDYCLNGAQIMSVRLVPMIVFMLNLRTVYDLFTVSEHRIRFPLHVLGITSAFTFVIITILIYNNTCGQLYVTFFVFAISAILFLLVIRDAQVHDERRRASRNS